MSMERHDIESILKQRGAVLARTKKHQCWRFPDGRVFVMGSTPGDRRAMENNYHNLLHFLGEKREIKKNPQRARKPGVKGTPILAPSEYRLPRNWRLQLAKLLPVSPPFVPQPSCMGFHVEHIPMTPLTAILRRLFP